jgi:ribosomal protein L3
VQLGFGSQKAQRVSRRCAATSRIAKGRFGCCASFSRQDAGLEVGRDVRVADVFQAGDRRRDRDQQGKGTAGVMSAITSAVSARTEPTKYFRHGSSIGNRSYLAVSSGKRMSGRMGNSV